MTWTYALISYHRKIILSDSEPGEEAVIQNCWITASAEFEMLDMPGEIQ